jgi:hypothetical protein
VQGFLTVGLLGALSLALIVVFIKRLPGHTYRRRLYLTVAAATCGLALLAYLNQWPSYLSDYDTAKPLANFLAQMAVTRLIGVLFYAGAGLLGALGVDVFLRVGIGERHLTTPSLPLPSRWRWW